MWDERYSNEDYAYGIAPNVFLGILLRNINLKDKYYYQQKEKEEMPFML